MTEQMIAAAAQPLGVAGATLTPRRTSNTALVTKLLTRARGATVTEMQEATGWQSHSARAFLSGLRKAGRTLIKEERKSGETCYRIAAAPLIPISEASE